MTTLYFIRAFEGNFLTSLTDRYAKQELAQAEAIKIAENKYLAARIKGNTKIEVWDESRVSDEDKRRYGAIAYVCRVWKKAGTIQDRYLICQQELIGE